MAGPALVDSGLFAPVAAQYAERIGTIDRLAGGPVTPERVMLLVEAGRVDEAASLLGTLKGTPRQVAGVRARVYLARLDFAAAAPWMQKIIAEKQPTDRERQLRFAWDFLHDDAAEVDRRTRGISLAPGTRAGTPELLAAGRLAYDMLDFARADSCYSRALERATDGTKSDDSFARLARVEALTGLGKVAYRRRDYDGSLERHREAVTLDASPEALRCLGETLIRLGLVESAIAVEHDIAAREKRRFGAGSEGTCECSHRQIVGHQKAVEADLAADDLAHHPRT